MYYPPWQYVSAVSAFVAQSKGKKGSSSLGTGKQTLRISGKGQGKVEEVGMASSLRSETWSPFTSHSHWMLVCVGKVEEVGMASSLKCTVPQNFNLRPMQ